MKRRILTPELQQGWLCFEGAGEKRRLAPVPPDWERCSEAQLQLYWNGAEVVRPREPKVSDAEPPVASE